MEKKTVAEITRGKIIDDLLQSVLDILEADDGRTFEEKRADATNILRKKKESVLAEMMADRMEAEQKGGEIKNTFWNMGDSIHASPEIELRKVCDADREKFLEVRLDY